MKQVMKHPRSVVTGWREEWWRGIESGTADTKYTQEIPWWKVNVSPKWKILALLASAWFGQAKGRRQRVGMFEHQLPGLGVLFHFKGQIVHKAMNWFFLFLFCVCVVDDDVLFRSSLYWHSVIFKTSKTANQPYCCKL